MTAHRRDGFSAERLPDAVQRLLSEHGWQPFRVSVPGAAPGTKAQWREWSDAHWPLAWRVPVRPRISLC